MLVIVSCKDVTSLDDALIRTGRLQHHIELRLPTRSDITCMLRKKLQTREEQELARNVTDITPVNDGRLLCDDDVDVVTLANVILASRNHPTGSTISGLCRKAALNGIKEFISGPRSLEENVTVRIAMKHFFEALKNP